MEGGGGNEVRRLRTILQLAEVHAMARRAHSLGRLCHNVWRFAQLDNARLNWCLNETADHLDLLRLVGTQTNLGMRNASVSRHHGEAANIVA